MENIPQKIQELQSLCALQAQQIAELTAKVNWYEEQYRLSQKQRYGRSSESTDQNQLQIFNEIEAQAKPSEPEPVIEEITYRCRKKQGQRDEQLKDLPVERKEYRLPVEEQVCPSCGGELHEMSTQTRREIEIIPAQTVVVEHVSYIYACRRCEREGTSTPIITAPAPKPPLPGSLASPSAIAYIMTAKYVDGLPLYRQEKSLSRLGIELSRQTMANWMLKSSECWLEPLYDRLHELLLKRDVLHADETTLQVLREDGREATSKSYMWLYRTGREEPAIVLYDYQTTRAGKYPLRFLEGFSGYLHVDGFAGYHNLPGMTLVGCWSHARRQFNEALKVLPKEKQNADVAARHGLEFCNRLFALERSLKKVSDEERYQERLKRGRPILEEFRNWLGFQKPRVLPKSAFGQAINYCLNQWHKLVAYLADGRLEIDNNRSERSIKPFVIGRKGWLFSNTPRGAKASATIYSIVETAKENGLNPFTYLMYLFEQMPNMDDVKDQDALDELLPWSSSLPERCRIEKTSDEKPAS